MTSFRFKHLVLLFVCFLLFVVSAINGCGQGSTTVTTTTTTSVTTTTAAGQNITLSGTLAIGSITASGIKASSAASDYKLVVIDNTSKKTYAVAPESNGSFSVTLPNNASYEVSLVDESSANYFGPIVMSGNASSSEVIMGLKPTANTNLGQIVIDTTLKYAKPTSEPSSILNNLDKAAATTGKPKGAGGYGKQTISGITTIEGADMDKDGIPNLFDADEDNDGIMNGIISMPTAATVVSNTVETVYTSSNIWATHGTYEAAYNQISMWLNVIPKTAAKLNEIASIEVINVPSTIKDIATVRFSSSIGSPENYPAENSLWKTSGYQLYKTTTLSRNQWIISLCPKAIMNLGDTFTLRVYYTGGGYDDFYINMAYVLTDWARITTYNSIALITAEGTNSNPAIFSSSSLEVVISKPKDEDGNILSGLRYSIRYGTCEADQSGRYGVPGTSSEESITDSSPSSTTLTYTIHNLNVNAPNWAYYVTPVAESTDGQRNGEQTWFRRQ